MTRFQKALFTIAFVAVTGVAIYAGYLSLQLRAQNRELQQEHEALTSVVQQLRHERDEATNRLAGLNAELAGAKRSPSEILKLRSEVGTLRQEKADADSTSAFSRVTANPETRNALRENQKRVMSGVYAGLAKRLNWSPEQKAQFDDLIGDQVMSSLDLITQALRDHKSQADVRQMFSESDAAFQSKVKAALGDDAVAQYRDYTKSIGNTIFVEGMGPQLTGDAAAVAEKKRRLLETMQEVTQSELAAAGLPADYQTLTVLNFANYASEAEATFSLQLKDRILEQTAARAAAFLSADEVNKFQQNRTAAVNYSQNVIFVNRKMMAPAVQ